MNEYKRHHQTSINVQKQANLIWNVADILRGLYKPHEYGKVILPMTVIKRLHDTLLKTREEVLKTAENTQSMNDVMRERFLKDASGYSFYNTSLYTFETLLADPANIESNFRAYLNGFSENMHDILDNFKFDVEITTMADNDALFYVIQEFNKADAYLGPDKMTSTDMGYVFEELVRKFSESYNEEAGAHFTSRDIIYLMTDLLLIEDKDTLFKEQVFKTVYDQTMGTSQMLSAMTERIQDMNDTAEVATFGQELNPETYAIAKADTMIRGGDPENMALGSTLTSDQFEGFTFDYCISNPPFGVDWKKDQKAVRSEYELGELGRFGVGLPRVSDGQLLFQLNGLSKLNGDIVYKKNGSKNVDKNLRDTEDIPLTEDINEYFEREVLPFSQDAWMDRIKDKVGYEIPFTRLFYKYTPPEPSEVISERIKQLEESIIKNFQALSGKDVENVD
ncbi:type I restriction-modification system subunit M N-terminal domain-containing protein [Staphylococcus aureus]|uniref:type I restriction-modification system subunit M n=1 Tax=Staphylococcus aureus TaxID=1280 RepID=UPI00338F642F